MILSLHHSLSLTLSVYIYICTDITTAAVIVSPPLELDYMNMYIFTDIEEGQRGCITSALLLDKGILFQLHTCVLADFAIQQAISNKQLYTLEL